MNGMISSAAVVAYLFTSAAAEGDYRATFDALNAEFAAVYSAGDGATVASISTEGALVLPLDTSEIRRHAEIEALWQSWLDAGIKNLVITTKSVDGSGYRTYEVGEFSADAPHGNGGMVKPSAISSWSGSGVPMVHGSSTSTAGTTRPLSEVRHPDQQPIKQGARS